MNLDMFGTSKKIISPRNLTVSARFAVAGIIMATLLATQTEREVAAPYVAIRLANIR